MTTQDTSTQATAAGTHQAALHGDSAPCAVCGGGGSVSYTTAAGTETRERCRACRGGGLAMDMSGEGRP